MDSLKSLITTKGYKPMQLKEISQIIKQVTGNIGRKEGIFYKKMKYLWM